MLAVPLWAQLACGGCGGGFEGNARSVPNFKDVPACPRCWAQLNSLRVQLDLEPWETPVDAYPAAPANT